MHSEIVATVKVAFGILSVICCTVHETRAAQISISDNKKLRDSEEIPCETPDHGGEFF